LSRGSQQTGSTYSRSSSAFFEQTTAGYSRFLLGHAGNDTRLLECWLGKLKWDGSAQIVAEVVAEVSDFPLLSEELVQVMPVSRCE
jgi:hypothetical protein